MKILSFTLILLLVLFLAAALTFLIMPAKVQSLSDVVATAQAEGWIHGRNGASAIWVEYEALQHAVTDIGKKRVALFGPLVLCLLFSTYWIKRQQRVRNLTA